MRKLIGVSSLIFLLSPLASPADDLDCANNSNPVAIEKVRMQREVFNRAIADKDLQSIQSVLDKDVLLLTGTDSDLYSGRMLSWRLESEIFTTEACNGGFCQAIEP